MAESYLVQSSTMGTATYTDSGTYHWITWDDVGTVYGVYHGLSRVDPDMEMDIGL